ncbi:MAG TPA: hypothetical protein VH601_11375 [Bryobacteraceae bacterium]
MVRFIDALSEDYVVAHFLKHEIRSDRFGGAICDLLQQNGWPVSLLERPDLQSAEQCSIRAKVLSEFRGYQRNEGMFEGFPKDVAWARFAISSLELMQVRYIDYSYWNELSGGSRLPSDAAIRIRKGATVFGMSTHHFLDMAEALRNGAKSPELIVVGTEANSTLVVLEGHARLTVYALVPDFIPKDLTVIVGLSAAMSAWRDFPSLDKTQLNADRK